MNYSLKQDMVSCQGIMKICDVPPLDDPKESEDGSRSIGMEIGLGYRRNNAGLHVAFQL